MVLIMIFRVRIQISSGRFGLSVEWENEPLLADVAEQNRPGISPPRVFFEKSAQGVENKGRETEKE
jgi:hypothetical protein